MIGTVAANSQQETKTTLSLNLCSPALAHRNPVPPQRWHFTTLSPFLTKPLPSQFLHLAFFFIFGPFSLAITHSPKLEFKTDWRSNKRVLRQEAGPCGFWVWALQSQWNDMSSPEKANGN
jgi:hypothetical protein